MKDRTILYVISCAVALAIAWLCLSDWAREWSRLERPVFGAKLSDQARHIIVGLIGVASLSRLFYRRAFAIILALCAVYVLIVGMDLNVMDDEIGDLAHGIWLLPVAGFMAWINWPKPADKELKEEF